MEKIKHVEMPTIRELMKTVGHECKSIRYGHSRTILKYLNDKVLAYGLGYGGFVCVFQTVTRLIKAYSFGLKHPFSSYPECGFADMNKDTIMKEINENELFVKRAISEDFDKVIERHKVKYPLLATIKIKRVNNRQTFVSGESEYIIQRLKTKILVVKEINKWHTTGIKIDRKSFVNNYLLATGERKSEDENNIYSIVSCDAPKELMEEIKTQVMLEML